VASEVSWITLGDVVKIKKVADGISFLRLYFLKSSDEQVNALKIERAASHQEGGAAAAYFNLQGLEIVDCVLSIFLFELYRQFRSGRSLHSKDQFQFKVLYFFSRLKSAKLFDAAPRGIDSPELVRRRHRMSAIEDSEGETESSQELCELID
jgi:hypothetical protein